VAPCDVKLKMSNERVRVSMLLHDFDGEHCVHELHNILLVCVRACDAYARAVRNQHMSQTPSVVVLLVWDLRRDDVRALRALLDDARTFAGVGAPVIVAVRVSAMYVCANRARDLGHACRRRLVHARLCDVVVSAPAALAGRTRATGARVRAGQLHRHTRERRRVAEPHRRDGGETAANGAFVCACCGVVACDVAVMQCVTRRAGGGGVDRTDLFATAQDSTTSAQASSAVGGTGSNSDSALTAAALTALLASKGVDAVRRLRSLSVSMTLVIAGSVGGARAMRSARRHAGDGDSQQRCASAHLATSVCVCVCVCARCDRSLRCRDMQRRLAYDQHADCCKRYTCVGVLYLTTCA
jgi:hypothetical protein